MWVRVLLQKPGKFRCPGNPVEESADVGSLEDWLGPETLMRCSPYAVGWSVSMGPV
jgi:hypothetical protein